MASNIQQVLFDWVNTGLDGHGTEGLAGMDFFLIPWKVNNRNITNGL